jgi:Flp pilus assembly protein TadD
MTAPDERRPGGIPPAAAETPRVDTLIRDGQAAFNAGEFARAEQIFRQWTRAEPDNARAWNNLGVALKAQGGFEAAVTAYRRSVELDPRRASTLSNFGNVLTQLGRLDEALDCLNRAATLDPAHASTQYNLACAAYAALRFDEAYAALERARALEPDNPQYLFDRGVIDLRLGNYAAGWSGFEHRWALPGVRRRELSVPMWDGVVLDGKRLLVHAEQGFGDNMLAARFLPEVRARGARVIVETRAELLRLFTDLPGADELRAESAAPTDIDMHCPIMTLPARCGATLQSLPPPARLHVPGQARRQAAAALAPHAARFKVGIVWCGSRTFSGNHQRACAAADFMTLGRIPGVQLFSLQVGESRGELRASDPSGMVVDLADHLADFADTAAFVERLDLVVMTDTSVAHLAGSLGRPVWNLLGNPPYWLYGVSGERTPWYPSMRLFRQQSPLDWPAMFENVARELRTAVAASGLGQ